MITDRSHDFAEIHMLTVVSVYWHEIPLIRVCLPFLAGIFVGQIWTNPLPSALGAGIVAICGISLIGRRLWRHRFALRTLAMTACLFAIGCLLRFLAEPDEALAQSLSGQPSRVRAVVESIEGRHDGQKVVLRIPSRPGDTKAVAYYRDSTRSLQPLDTLSFEGKLELIPDQQNPFTFDLAGYYRSQGILLRTVINPGQVIDIRAFQGWHPTHCLAQVRERLSTILHTYVPNPPEHAILRAMTLGIRSDLDPQIRDIYARSGAMHILAISGLHVGIVSYLLFLLVGRARPSDRILVRCSRVMLLLTGVWSFACITGLTPSILRSALMFSLYFGGVVLRRHAHALNILAFTAFCCLCWNPLLINIVSFQFSYLALLGILLFFRPIYRSLHVKHPISKFIWASMVMSVSAQIFLFPLLIYYFHQISLISVISGVIAIPAAYLILTGGMLLFILHAAYPPLAIPLGSLLGTVIELLNTMLGWMSQMPWACIDDLSISNSEVIMVFALLVFFCARRMVPAPLRQAMIMILAGGIALSQMIHRHGQDSSNALAIYPSGQTLLVDYASHGFGYSSFSPDTLDYYLRQEVLNFRMWAGTARSTVSGALPTVGRWLIRLPVSVDTEGPQILLIGQDHPEEDLAIIREHCPELVVLGTSLPPWTRMELTQGCLTLGVSVHDLRKDGACYLFYHNTNTGNETPWESIKK